MTPMVTIIPVKDTRFSKQRTSSRLDAGQRQRLALTMLEDVLDAVAPTRDRSAIVLVTVDPNAAELAARYGATTTDVGAHDGHTGSVMAAARYLCRDSRRGFLTVPGDIPLITAGEVNRLLDAHDAAGRAFTIAPSHDELGSNAVACSPFDAVPLRFGDDSYRPHLSTARQAGIEPTIVALPGIAQDIDTPADLDRFMTLAEAPPTRTYSYLETLQRHQMAPTEGTA
jgi:2-phospho-L-lactate guanylyltransferase